MIPLVCGETFFTNSSPYCLMFSIELDTCSVSDSGDGSSFKSKSAITFLPSVDCWCSLISFHTHKFHLVHLIKRHSGRAKCNTATMLLDVIAPLKFRSLPI
uniref:AlNc14C19G1968 protein n=1 Tax=Albugo laibachii Nc14 TaxID=890382 RepID=F0W4Z8_9STRA|nr:AlNc14C19G1968 [Albugo laibachii Nc14]|eukprot:CCA16188.1 AlNc14C19G1968 [Albugo laibachii Nc14]